jgi:hypothetical protein
MIFQDLPHFVLKKKHRGGEIFWTPANWGFKKGVHGCASTYLSNMNFFTGGRKLDKGDVVQSFHFATMLKFLIILNNVPAIPSPQSLF